MILERDHLEKVNRKNERNVQHRFMVFISVDSYSRDPRTRTSSRTSPLTEPDHGQDNFRSADPCITQRVSVPGRTIFKGRILSRFWSSDLWFLAKTRVVVKFTKQSPRYLISIGNKCRSMLVKFFSTLHA